MVQFPVKVAFAITINRSQNFNHLGCDFTKGPFTHGQLYVALSRISNLRFLLNKERSQQSCLQRGSIKFTSLLSLSNAVMTTVDADAMALTSHTEVSGFRIDFDFFFFFNLTCD